jgi:hypothetical protein
VLYSSLSEIHYTIRILRPSLSKQAWLFLLQRDRDRIGRGASSHPRCEGTSLVGQRAPDIDLWWRGDRRSRERSFSFSGLHPTDKANTGELPTQQRRKLRALWPLEVQQRIHTLPAQLVGSAEVHDGGLEKGLSSFGVFMYRGICVPAKRISLCLMFLQLRPPLNRSRSWVLESAGSLVVLLCRHVFLLDVFPLPLCPYVRIPVLSKAGVRTPLFQLSHIAFVLVSKALQPASASGSLGGGRLEASSHFEGEGPNKHGAEDGGVPPENATVNVSEGGQTLAGGGGYL